LEISEITEDINEKIYQVDRAIEINPFSHEALDLKGRLLIIKHNSITNKNEEDANYTAAFETLQLSISLEPSSKNNSWKRLYDFIANHCQNTATKKAELEKIISSLSVQGEYKYNHIHCKSKFIKEYEEKDKSKYFNKIQGYELKLPFRSRIFYLATLLEVSSRFELSEETKRLAETISSSEEALTNIDLACAAAEAFSEKTGDFNKSSSIILNCKGYSEDTRAVRILVTNNLCLRDYEAAQDALNSSIKSLSKTDHLELQIQIHDVSDNTNEALNLQREHERISKDQKTTADITYSVPIAIKRHLRS